MIWNGKKFYTNAIKFFEKIEIKYKIKIIFKCNILKVFSMMELYLQFPIATWVWPKWIPIIGGETYTFFEYVFNFADSSISLGIAIIIFFDRRLLTN